MKQEGNISHIPIILNPQLLESLRIVSAFRQCATNTVYTELKKEGLLNHRQGNLPHIKPVIDTTVDKLLTTDGKVLKQVFNKTIVSDLVKEITTSLLQYSHELEGGEITNHLVIPISTISNGVAPNTHMIKDFGSFYLTKPINLTDSIGGGVLIITLDLIQNPLGRNKVGGSNELLVSHITITDNGEIPYDTDCVEFKHHLLGIDTREGINKAVSYFQ